MASNCSWCSVHHDEIDLKASALMELASAMEVKPGYFFGDEPLEHYVESNEKKTDGSMDRDIADMEKAMRSIGKPETRRFCVETVKGIAKLG